MESKEIILKLLAKYGLDSVYHDPYLYEKDGHFGLVYSFSHVHYGFLTRAVFFSQEEEMDDFLYQYWWYKKYGTNYQVTLELDNYEVFEVRPQFFYQGKDINAQGMKDLLVDALEIQSDQKSVKFYQRLIRTARILLEAIELKTKVQFDTFKSVKELDNEWKRQENEFLQLYNRHQKDHKPLLEVEDDHEDFVRPHELDDFSLQLDWFLKHESEEELRGFIVTLWTALHSLEKDIRHLQNKYLLIKLPLDLDDVRKKKVYMENLLNKKKGLFSKKEHPLTELMKIEENSETKKIVPMEDYIKNEEKRLEEKYAVISEMDYVTLGDYLNEFDNLGIDCSLDIKEEKVLKKYSHDELLSSLKEIYNHLSLDEQMTLAVYHSFLSPLCDEVLLRLMDGEEVVAIQNFLKSHYLEEVGNAMNVIMDAENVFIRMKKMKMLSLSSVDHFCSSLIQVCKSLLAITAFQISGISYYFGKSLLEDQEFLLYHASCRNSGCPNQRKGAFDVHDIIELHEMIPLWFCPSYYSLKDPYFHDYSLQEIDNNENVLLNFKNCRVNWKDSVIINVSRYKIERSGKVVSQVRLLKTEVFRRIVVTR